MSEFNGREVNNVTLVKALILKNPSRKEEIQQRIENAVRTYVSQ